MPPKKGLKCKEMGMVLGFDLVRGGVIIKNIKIWVDSQIQTFLKMGKFSVFIFHEILR